MKPVSKNRRQAGFTLVELVIAIALLTVIMSVAYSALSAIVRSKSALDDGRDADLTANALLLRMTRELSSIVLKPTDGNLNPCPPHTPQSANQTTILGLRETLTNGERGDSLTFIAANAAQYMPDGSSHSTLVQISYRIEELAENEEGPLSYVLIREEIPYPGPKTAPRGSNLPSGVAPACGQMFRFPLSDRVKSLKFQYYDAQNQRWEDSIGGQNTNPRARLIRFSLTLVSPLGIERSYATSVPIAES